MQLTMALFLFFVELIGVDFPSFSGTFIFALALVFGVGASFLVSAVTFLLAHFAAPPSLFGIGLVRKTMTVDAVSFTGIDGGRRIRSNCVLSLSNKFQVVRVDADRIVTNNVVKTVKTAFRACGNGAFYPCVQNPVDQMLDTTVSHPSPVLSLSPSPYPTTGLGVYSDFGKDALVFVRGETNCEILSGSHAVYSYQVDGVVRADSVRPTPSRLDHFNTVWAWVKE